MCPGGEQKKPEPYKAVRGVDELEQFSFRSGFSRFSTASRHIAERTFNFAPTRCFKGTSARGITLTDGQRTMMPTPTRAAKLAAWAALCLALPAHAAAAAASAAPSSMPAHHGVDGAAHITQLGLHVRREIGGKVEHMLDGAEAAARMLDGAEAAALPLRKTAGPPQTPRRDLSVDQMGCAWIPIGGGQKKMPPLGDGPASAP